MVCTNFADVRWRSNQVKNNLVELWYVDNLLKYQWFHEYTRVLITFRLSSGSRTIAPGVRCAVCVCVCVSEATVSESVKLFRNSLCLFEGGVQSHTSTSIAAYRHHGYRKQDADDESSGKLSIIYFARFSCALLLCCDWSFSSLAKSILRKLREKNKQKIKNIKTWEPNNPHNDKDLWIRIRSKSAHFPGT